MAKVYDIPRYTGQTRYKIRTLMSIAVSMGWNSVNSVIRKVYEDDDSEDDY